MADNDEQSKEHSKISMRIGEVQVEFEGTPDNIKKLMDKELFDFAKRLEGTAKQLPPSTENAPKITPRPSEVAPKEKAVPPPSPSKSSTAPEAPSRKSRFFTIGKKTEKTDKKKIGWKNLAIALVMVCIVLLASVIGVIAVYLSMVSNVGSQITDKDTEISSLNSQISSLNSQISALENETTVLHTEIQGLNSQILKYMEVVYLDATEYLMDGQSVTQTANTYTVICNTTVSFAGYVSMAVTSTSNTTYAQVIYSSFGVNYNHNVTVGTSGTAAFPILPGIVEIRIGNLEPSYAVDTTVTAIYVF